MAEIEEWRDAYNKFLSLYKRNKKTTFYKVYF